MNEMLFFFKIQASKKLTMNETLDFFKIVLLASNTFVPTTFHL